jgi:hypothetical protein
LVALLDASDAAHGWTVRQFRLNSDFTIYRKRGREPISLIMPPVA